MKYLKTFENFNIGETENFEGITHVKIKGEEFDYTNADEVIEPSDHPLGTIYVKDGYGYVQSGYFWYKFPMEEWNNRKKSFENNQTQIEEPQIEGIEKFNDLINSNPEHNYYFSPFGVTEYKIKEVTKDGIIGENGKLYNWYNIQREGGRGSRNIFILINDSGYLNFKPDEEYDSEKNYWETKADIDDLGKDIEDSMS